MNPREIALRALHAAYLAFYSERAPARALAFAGHALRMAGLAYETGASPAQVLAMRDAAKVAARLDAARAAYKASQTNETTTN